MIPIEAMGEYCWGDQVFAMPVLGIAVLMAAVLTTTILSCTTPTGPPAGISASTMGGVIFVTLGWILLYYNMVNGQVALKLMFNNPNEQAKLVGERSLMNTLEQGIVFLLLLWLHAIFVDVATSVSMGWMYVIARGLYPVFYAFYGHFTVLAEFATQPNYFVIMYFGYSLAYASWYPESKDFLANPAILANFSGVVKAILLFLLVILAFIVFQMLWQFPVGFLAPWLNNKNNPKDEGEHDELENGDDEL